MVKVIRLLRGLPTTDTRDLNLPNPHQLGSSHGRRVHDIEFCLDFIRGKCKDGCCARLHTPPILLLQILTEPLLKAATTNSPDPGTNCNATTAIPLAVTCHDPPKVKFPSGSTRLSNPQNGVRLGDTHHLPHTVNTHNNAHSRPRDVILKPPTSGGPLRVRGTSVDFPLSDPHTVSGGFLSDLEQPQKKVS
ncbi:hypothetical protein BV25DRAFT_189076 [Artomyces pyxidatus]|uniref:Uncharacterized protein n=1 Tax=Artomyces pyxidatus TaxID=48021 RepID=A0ACB8T9F0_9AGAM|nr:hypothetical protein BV25DRAFT_189076 [Artomyces pyxidatus]